MEPPRLQSSPMGTSPNFAWNRGGKNCNISDRRQDRTKVAINYYAHAVSTDTEISDTLDDPERPI